MRSPEKRKPCRCRALCVVWVGCRIDEQSQVGAVVQLNLDKPESTPVCTLVKLDRRVELVNDIKYGYEPAVSALGGGLVKELSADARPTYSWIDHEPGNHSEVRRWAAQLCDGDFEAVGSCGWVQRNMPDDLRVVEGDPGHERLV